MKRPITLLAVLLSCAAATPLMGATPVQAQKTLTDDEVKRGEERDKAGQAIGRSVRGFAKTGATLADQRTFLQTKLVGEGLEEATAAALVGKAVDGVSMRPTTEPRASHLGGKALLAPGERWPINERDRRKLSVLAVLDLAELRAMPPLPPDGSLVLFYDNDGIEARNIDAWLDVTTNVEVRWIPPGTATREVKAPRPATTYRRQSLTGLTMPIVGGLDWTLDLPGSEQSVVHAEEIVWGVQHGAYTGEQLLGASQDVQGPVLEEIASWLKTKQYASRRGRYSAAERRGKGWTLVAQISGGRDERMMFADAGNVSFAVPTLDLAARRFDRAVAIMQSH